MKLYFELLKYPVFTYTCISGEQMLHWRTVIKLQVQSHLPLIFLIIRQWNIMELVTRFFMRFMYLQIPYFEILNLMDTRFVMCVLNVMRELKQ